MQAHGQLAGDVADLASDRFGRGCPPVEALGTCTDHQGGRLDLRPVERRHGNDPTRIEQIARGAPRDQRDQLAGDDLMNVENRHIRGLMRSDCCQRHAIHAVKGTAEEIVDVDLDGSRPAERGGIAVDPFAPRMLRRLAPRGIAFRFHQPLDPVLQARAVRIHPLLLNSADIVDVDIDREAVQIGMENVERRAAFHGDARPDQRVGAKSVENVNQPDHALQRRGLKLPLRCKVLKRFS